MLDKHPTVDYEIITTVCSSLNKLTKPIYFVKKLYLLDFPNLLCVKNYTKSFSSEKLS